MTPPDTSGSRTALDWTRSVLASDATLEQAIRNLNESELQIALVVDPGGALVGTLTDGDIRRGLLRGMRLESSIAGIVSPHPLVVPPQLERSAALQLMRSNRVHQLPVIDEHRRVVGLHLLDDILSPRTRPNTVLIMAGGEGRRLRPYTENCPKPLLPVRGKPMLEHIIDNAKTEGFSRFVLSVHYLGHMIEEHFGDGSAWGVKITYLREDRPLGTAGALSLIEPRPDLPMVVSNGDVVTDVSYGELLDFHCFHKAAGTMAVRQYEWQNPFGVVLTAGINITGFDEKPVSRSYINAGIYVLDPEAFGALEPGTACDMPALFAQLRERQQRTIAFPMHEPWVDVGRVDDFEKSQQP